jgi:hypothetical protein
MHQSALRDYAGFEHGLLSASMWVPSPAAHRLLSIRIQSMLAYALVQPRDSVASLKARTQECERELVVQTLAAIALGELRLVARP